MRNDLAIQGVMPISAPAEAASKAKTDTTAANEATAAATASPIFVNPAMKLDAGLGIVVIEFRDASGSVTHTFPSEQQLQAYRHSDATASSAAKASPTSHAASDARFTPDSRATPDNRAAPPAVTDSLPGLTGLTEPIRA